MKYCSAQILHWFQTAVTQFLGIHIKIRYFKIQGVNQYAWSMDKSQLCSGDMLVAVACLVESKPIGNAESVAYSNEFKDIFNICFNNKSDLGKSHWNYIDYVVLLKCSFLVWNEW